MKLTRTLAILALAFSSAAHAGGRTEAQMQNWMAATRPVAEHAKLAALAGAWKVHQRDFDQAGAPWSEADGTAEFGTFLDGRFLQQELHTALMGHPFNGVSLLGYNRESGQYVGTWMDNFGTSMMPLHGGFDAAGKVLTMEGTDGWSLKETWIDARHHRMEWWGPGPGGKPMLKVEVVYERAA
ncbi:MAG: DUF1579 family protein [Telluria sp.]